MRHALAVLALCAGLAACDDPPPAPPALGDDALPNVEGAWTGEVVEDDRTYDLVLTIDHLERGAAAGTTAYSGDLACTGTLTFEGVDRRVLSFREALDGSPGCPGGGRVDVRLRSDGRLGWLWTRADGDAVPDARATLDRQ